MTALAQHPWVMLPLVAMLTAGAGWLLTPVALRTGWIDRPGARKVHDEPTPLTGGIAVLLGLIAGHVVTGYLAAGDIFVPVVLAGGGVLLITGLADDLGEISATLRFLVQLGVCLLVVRYTGIRLEDFGSLFSPALFGLGWFTLPVTVFAAMGVINAFNLIDGLDGLAGSLFIVAAAGLVLFAGLAGEAAVRWLLLVSIAAVAGFLALNARWPWNTRARLFLGDSGSLLLGFLLAWCCIRLGSGPQRALMPMTAVWLVAVPLLDTSTLIWTRWREGRSAIIADQRHLHHAFLRAGFSAGQAWLAISLLAIALGAAGVGFELAGVPDYLSFYSFMAFAFTYYFYLRHSWAAQRFLGRHFIHHDFVIEEGYA
jgi:UDP-GlcNAc:undecaprenyl-phosphate GlcNAc-1-phosphate transferase